MINQSINKMMIVKMTKTNTLILTQTVPMIMFSSDAYTPLPIRNIGQSFVFTTVSEQRFAQFN